MEIIVKTVPPKEESEQVNLKIQKIVEDRNAVIAKRFGMDPVDVNVNLYRSKGALASRIDTNGEGLGVFGGYVDGTSDILLFHPENAAPIFGDNLYKEMGILSDYGLTKMYMCKKYYPKREDFRLYYKYISEMLAQVSAGNFKENIAKFDMKTYFEGKKYRKDQEVGIVFYLMREHSGIDFIFENLDKIVQDCDIKKTILGLINDLEEKEFTKLKSTEDKQDIVIKYAACRTAIKFQDKLSNEEQIKLLEDILIIKDNINTCPHGRPFVMELTLDQLAKNFKRK